MTTQLPEGYSTRPALADDIAQLAVLDATYTRSVVGKALRNENEIRTEWKSPTFDPATDSQVVVFVEDEIIGWCEVYDQAPHTRISSRLRVSPASDRCVATRLIEWCIERARCGANQAAAGERVILTQAAFESDVAGTARLKAMGFKFCRCFLGMRIEMATPPLGAIWPDGILVRSMIPGQDDRAAVEAVRDAFRDHWGYVESSLEEDLEEWRQWIYEDEDFDTDLWFLAMDGDEIAGFCQCYPIAGDDPATGLVDELGVRPPWRRRGLATALLRHAFRAFYDRGVRNVELGVDAESPTGATDLYERAGMRVMWKNLVHELELRPGG